MASPPIAFCSGSRAMPVSSRTSSDRLATTPSANAAGIAITPFAILWNQTSAAIAKSAATSAKIQNGNPVAPATSAATSPNGSTLPLQRKLASARRLRGNRNGRARRFPRQLRLPLNSQSRARYPRPSRPRLSTRNHPRFPPWPNGLRRHPRTQLPQLIISLRRNPISPTSAPTSANGAARPPPVKASPPSSSCTTLL